MPLILLFLTADIAIASRATIFDRLPASLSAASYIFEASFHEFFTTSHWPLSLAGARYIDSQAITLMP